MAGSPTTYVALLRGINVGGARKVPMKDLKALVEASGAQDVSTYIQSGNVIFRHPQAEAALTRDLETRLHERFGWDIAVMLRTRTELAKIVKANPYPDEADDPTKVFVVFLRDAVKAAAAKAVDTDAYAPDRFTAKGRELYLHLPNGAGRSKLLGAIERTLKVSGTARNWRSVTKLLELASDLG